VADGFFSSRKSASVSANRSTIALCSLRMLHLSDASNMIPRNVFKHPFIAERHIPLTFSPRRKPRPDTFRTVWPGGYLRLHESVHHLPSTPSAPISVCVLGHGMSSLCSLAFRSTLHGAHLRVICAGFAKRRFAVDHERRDGASEGGL
jgi:hypothetical protein